MRHIKGFVIGLAIVVICAVWLGSGGCNADKPTQPTAPKDYAVYFWDASHDNWYYSYRPLSNALDSFYLPFRTQSIVVSADGQHLYVYAGSFTAVVNLDSHTVKRELPGFTPLAVSPDNRLVAMEGADGLHILRTSDYSVAYYDTTVVQRGVFSADSKSFYGVGGWVPHGSPYAYQTDITDTATAGSLRWFADGSPSDFVPSLDETRMFLYLSYSTFGSLFAVYDAASDSIIFRDFFSP
ncbi:MAG: hypothetical protein DRP45_00290, partial [Candidatus Zixiibacteriota bacterium]